MAMLYSEYQTNLVMTIHKRGSKFRAQFKDVGEVHTQLVLDANAGCTIARLHPAPWGAPEKYDEGEKRRGMCEFAAGCLSFESFDLRGFTMTWEGQADGGRRRGAHT